MPHYTKASSFGMISIVTIKSGVMISILIITSLLTWIVVHASTSPNKDRPATQLYGTYCITCHGRDGRSQTNKGKYSHARDLTDAAWQEDVSDERIYNSIMNGRNLRGNMPAFKDKLSEKEADSLVGFVREFRK
jgi:mono/diheme cytochrome c family protein